MRLVANVGTFDWMLFRNKSAAHSFSDAPIQRRDGDAKSQVAVGILSKGCVRYCSSMAADVPYLVYGYLLKLGRSASRDAQIMHGD